MLLRSAGMRFGLIYAALLPVGAGAGHVPVVVHGRAARPRRPTPRSTPTRRASTNATPRAGCRRSCKTIERAARRTSMTTRSICWPIAAVAADRRQPGPLAGRRCARMTNGRAAVERAGMIAGPGAPFDLPGGFRLLVGRDVQVPAQLWHLLTDALLWALRWWWCWRRRGAHRAQPVPPHARRRVRDRRGDRAPAISRQRVRCPAAATSSTCWRRRSTTCWTGSAG